MTAPLARWTTLGVGGPPQRLIEARTRSELVEAVSRADADGEPLLILGGGSNVVISDDGFPGTVVVVRTRGIAPDPDTCAGGWVEVEAGESWDDFVRWCIDHEYRGVEALSGIPGSVGATPIQNVGAYGQEVSSVIARVAAFDRRERREVVFPLGECGFGYRSSRFKTEPGRFVILSVAFQLGRGDLSAPIAYAELADALGVWVGERVRSVDVRAAVLALRRSKGMVVDPADPDSASVGSFFVNPIVPADMVPDGARAWPQEDGRVKVSAAWLVEQAGFPRGFALADSAAAISGKHTLALTNRGTASAAQIMDLATEIRSGVHRSFRITLDIEPVLVGLLAQ